MSDDSPEEIVRKAKKLSGKNQTDFGELLNKTQSQISKYIRGDVVPNAEVIIKCMNIIHSEGESAGNLTATKKLALRIELLDGKKHQKIRKAFISMLDAYEAAESTRKPKPNH